MTAFGVFITMFIQPIVGVLSDRTRSAWGRRAPWVAGGAVLGALLLIALRYSTSIVFMAIFWALAQLIINAAQGPLTATVADRVVPEKVGSASAISGLGLMAGAILGSVAAGILFGAMGLDAYYPFALALAITAVLFVLFARDRSSKDLEVEPLHLGRFFASFLIPLRDADYRWVWIAKIVMMFGYTVSTAFSFFMLQGYVRPALSPAEATATAPLLALAGSPSRRASPTEWCTTSSTCRASSSCVTSSTRGSSAASSRCGASSATGSGRVPTPRRSVRAGTTARRTAVA